MSTPEIKAAITLSLTDLENLIRRVVREELARVMSSSPASILDDWSQEGPEDPAGDEELLADALAMSQRYRERREGWKDWEEFKAELRQEADADDALSD